VGGFDVLYACQDLEFDRAHGLHSIPQRFGIPASLAISRGLHVVTVAALTALAAVAPLGPIYLAGVGGVAALLAFEQSLVSARDLSRVKMAFDLNGWVGILYFFTTAAAIYAR
jgi:4-hydroxybenzoate polyprenyltransferase